MENCGGRSQGRFPQEIDVKSSKEAKSYSE
jgi:hypothetical protein